MSQLSDYLNAVRQAVVSYYAASAEPVTNIELMTDKTWGAIDSGEIVTPAIFIDVADIDFGDEDDDEDTNSFPLELTVDLHCVLSLNTADARLAILDFATQVASVVRCNEFDLPNVVRAVASGNIDVSPITAQKKYVARVVSIRQIIYIDSLNKAGPFVPWAGYDAEHQRNDTNPDPIFDIVDI